MITVEPRAKRTEIKCQEEQQKIESLSKCFRRLVLLC